MYQIVVITLFPNLHRGGLKGQPRIRNSSYLCREQGCHCGYIVWQVRLFMPVISLQEFNFHTQVGCQECASFSLVCNQRAADINCVLLQGVDLVHVRLTRLVSLGV